MFYNTFRTLLEKYIYCTNSGRCLGNYKLLKILPSIFFSKILDIFSDLFYKSKKCQKLKLSTTSGNSVKNVNPWGCKKRPNPVIVFNILDRLKNSWTNYSLLTLPTTEEV